MFPDTAKIIICFQPLISPTMWECLQGQTQTPEQPGHRKVGNSGEEGDHRQMLWQLNHESHSDRTSNNNQPTKSETTAVNSRPS